MIQLSILSVKMRRKYLHSELEECVLECKSFFSSFSSPWFANIQILLNPLVQSRWPSWHLTAQIQLAEHFALTFLSQRRHPKCVTPDAACHKVSQKPGTGIVYELLQERFSQFLPFQLPKTIVSTQMLQPYSPRVSKLMQRQTSFQHQIIYSNYMRYLQ